MPRKRLPCSVLLFGVLSVLAGCGNKFPPGEAGLRQQLLTLVAAAQAGRQSDVAAAFQTFALEPKQLAEVYGDDAGKAVAQAYPKAAEAFVKTGADAVSGAVQAGALNVIVTDVAGLATAGGAGGRAAQAKMAELKPGVQLFHAELRQPLQELGIPLGDFAYVDGGWRWVLAGPMAAVTPSASK